MSAPVRLAALATHGAQVHGCRACPQMIGPPVTGRPVLSPILLIGQAPGTHEGPAGQPFAWTAGKTLFRWFATLGVDEARFRERVYMAAVCRCFPGKAKGGGDRVPAPAEIARCSGYLAAEVRLLAPQLVIPVGKLAIAQVLPDAAQLVDAVGHITRARFHGRAVDVAPLPHPSGASTWHRSEPGATLLTAALAAIGDHPAWAAVRDRL